MIFSSEKSITLLKQHLLYHTHSAPAVGAQPGVGGQMLVAVVNPIQVEPHDKPHDTDTDTDNVLAALPGDDDDATQVLLL